MRDCYSLGASNALVFFSEQLAGIAVICFGRLLSTLFAWFLLCYNIISAIFLLLFPLSIQCMKKERESEREHKSLESAFSKLRKMECHMNYLLLNVRLSALIYGLFKTNECPMHTHTPGFGFFFHPVCRSLFQSFLSTAHISICVAFVVVHVAVQHSHTYKYKYYHKCKQ